MEINKVIFDGRDLNTATANTVDSDGLAVTHPASFSLTN